MSGAGAAGIRVSIGLTNYSWPGGPGRLGAELAGVVRGADQAGVDTVWVVDHLLQADPTAPPGDTEMLEAPTPPWGSWPPRPSGSGSGPWSPG